MFDYYFWGPILGLLITALGLIPPYYTAFFQHNEPMVTTESQATKTGRNDITRSGWWKSPQVIALFLLPCSLWGPYILSKVNEEDVVRGAGGIRSATIDNSTGRYIDFTLYVSIEGQDIYKYSPSWRVMAVGFVWTQDKDIDDVQDLQKSTPFDIKKEPMTFIFKGDHKFVDQLNKGAPVNYVLILLPKNLNPESFKTLRQAKGLGAKVITMGALGF